MKKKLLPVVPSGVELPFNRTHMTVGDLKEGEAAFLIASQIRYTHDRKGMLPAGAEISYLDREVPLTVKHQQAGAGYPVAWVRRNGAFFDVVVYYHGGYPPRYLKGARGQMEDGGKTVFFFSSYKDYPVEPGGRYGQVTWAMIPSGGEAPPPPETKKSHKAVKVEDSEF